MIQDVGGMSGRYTFDAIVVGKVQQKNQHDGMRVVDAELIIMSGQSKWKSKKC